MSEESKKKWQVLGVEFDKAQMDALKTMVAGDGWQCFLKIAKEVESWQVDMLASGKDLQGIYNTQGAYLLNKQYAELKTAVDQAEELTVAE